MEEKTQGAAAPQSLSGIQSERLRKLIPRDVEMPIPLPAHCLRCSRGCVVFLIGGNGLIMISRHRGRLFTCSASGSFSFLTSRREEEENLAIPADTKWTIVARYIGDAAAEAAVLAHSEASNASAPKGPPEAVSGRAAAQGEEK